MVNRRDFLTALAAAPVVMPAFSPGRSNAAVFASPPPSALNSRINELEQRSGGRLGVAVLDTHDGRRFAWRGDERFRMCSTFKMPLAAAILRRVDQGRERLDRRVTYGREVLMGNSPVVEKHLDRGMTIGELCAATITYSDNAAANLLLDALGAPTDLTRFLRALGDQTTRCDRREPELNTGAPDDPRDTTTPTAIAETWKTLLTTDTLSAASRKQLTAWVVANRTGGKRLRAGLPRSWTVGDKTGNNGQDQTNDIAVIWPPKRKPLFVAAFHDQGSADDDVRSAVLADVARAVVSAGFGV
ncbi:class A beta-lactamase [Caulobacter sp. FWC2]|uniref:class A beta-lactamase n=1 Tax=Caulobacter sp. FWC2 TaxID=69664 RepID=UPI000C14D467|nr:class A beta-lactamase [Caulobacter sp. FWC2]PIB93601.1 class A beta-lactamase [Caulobacter sp. FWC2]